MKFKVYLRFERTETIEVEASTAGEARENVMLGEYTNSQVVRTSDNNHEILEVEKVKSKKS